MARTAEFLRVAARPDTAWRALKLALVVGPLLILINQWDALFGATPFNLWKALLTLLVPYAVSTWTAASKETGPAPSG